MYLRNYQVYLLILKNSKRLWHKSPQIKRFNENLQIFTGPPFDTMESKKGIGRTGYPQIIPERTSKYARYIN